MRYRIQIESLMGCYLVVVTEYWQSGSVGGTSTKMYTIPADDLKVEDLQHVISWLDQEIASSTP